MAVEEDRSEKKPVRVFISYSHDSDEHRERVRGLGASLSRDGCDCRLDVYRDTDEDWPSWMTRQLREADFILCVVTETYARRFRDQELPDQGLGVGWEAGLIRRLLYAKKLHNDRILPAAFDGADRQHIPLELQGYDFFMLDAPAGYESLLRRVLKRPLHAKPATGTPPDLGTSTASPLFARPGAAPPSTGTASKAEISRILKYAPAKLIGREDEIKLLSDAWAKVRKETKRRSHVLTFVALGGEGKTALVAKWAAELAAQDWPGCDAAFAWSFYSQGTREQLAADSDLFLKAALTFFGNDADKQFAAGNAGAHEKGQRLAHLVGRRRSLLILDGLEPLQYAPASPTPGQLKDQGIAALLRALATASHGLCVVTTRYSLPDLKAFWQTTAPEVTLLRLSRAAGVHLLKTLGVRGTAKEFETMVEDVKGHALTLTLLGSYLHHAHGGDIRKRNLVKLEEADAEIEVIPEHLNHTFHVMDAYAKWFETGGKNEEENKKGRRALALLRLLGLFDRPATADCLTALWTGEPIPTLTEPLLGLNDAQRNIALTKLEAAKLLTVNRDAAGVLVSLDAHPHLREYFARQLRTQQPDAWRAAHRRLYEHLFATTKEGDQPTLEALQPLYQAVVHGCQAGLQQETLLKVYDARIKWRNDAYSLNRLAAFGADLGVIPCFLDQPWTRVWSSLGESEQAWLLSHAAAYLRALGRLTEALEPIRTATDWAASNKDWEHAAVGASNLSELELTLGEVAAAVRDAGQSVTYADRSGDAFWRCVSRVQHANMLYQAGNRHGAAKLFQEVEGMQAEREPNYPLLYSLQGFLYCDLLLTEAERAAWQWQVNQKSVDRKLRIELVEVCRAVEQRAGSIEKRTTGLPTYSLLDIALDHLTLGRAALYRAVLETSAIRKSESEIEQAVASLRHAATTHHIPRGLLTRAWLRTLTGMLTGPESAQSDIDEAWEIAECGPMPLFLADIHLYRARLFGPRRAETKYPWDSLQADLAEARRLIEKHGYGRRKEELADAEEAAKGW